VTREEVLARLVRQAGRETEERRRAVPEVELEKRAAGYEPKDFLGALRGPRLALIAEMNQRTPSMGVLTTDYRPANLARAYTAGGAAAISVLTHESGFGGRPEHIAEARRHTDLPILRKDFITSTYQVVEARAQGADAVLLIAAALSEPLLEALLEASRGQRLAALVEAHDEFEVARAVEAGAQAIGVNHRDLRTFKVDLGLTERLRRIVPPDVTFVAESGIHDAAGARRMRDAGADAILVGELLMRAADPAACIRELLSAG
jgi:indole-3-glycerol phosphate synthase